MGTSSFPQEQTAANDGLATRVRNLVAEQLEVATERVTDDARFDDLGADWLDHIELMMVMEDQFACQEIAEDDAERIVAVGDLIRFIETHLAE